MMIFFQRTGLNPGTLVSFAASLTFLLACPAISSSQQIPDNDADLIISKGTTIHRIDDVRTLPRTFNDIRENRRLAVVPAGKLMIRFNKIGLSSSTGMRHLVLTEEGIFGYLRSHKGLFEGESRLRTIVASGRHHVMIIKDSDEIIRENLKFKYSRGEIYRTGETSRDSNGLDYPIELQEDKVRQIADHNGVSEDRVEPSQSVPRDLVADLDFLSLMPDGKPLDLSTPRKRRATIADIYYHIPKFHVVPSATFAKRCGQAVTSKSDFASSAHFDLSGSAGASGSAYGAVAEIKATAGIKVSISKEISTILSFPKEEEVWSHLYVECCGECGMLWFSRETERAYFIRLVMNCDTREQKHLVQVPDMAEATISKKWVQDEINKDYQGPIEFEEESGHIILGTYNDYLVLKQALQEKKSYHPAQANFILTHIARIRRPETFFPK